MKKTSLIAVILCILMISIPCFAYNSDKSEDEYFDYNTREFLRSYGYSLSPDGTIIDYSGEYYDVMVIYSKLGDVQIKNLSAELFKGESVGSVYLEDGIEEIGDLCFASSSVDYIDIPASVKKVGSGAFKDCKNLSSLSIGSDKTEFGKDSLAGTDFLNIGVPCTVNLLSLHDCITDAKGDEEFTFDVMHTNLIESMVEKDIHGNNLTICEACGYKFKGYDDIEIPFEDVSKDSWYYPYVVTAYEFGIIKGKTEKTFDPNANMTLAEAAKIAACIHLNLLGGEDNFDAKGGKWYQPYVDYCYDTQIIDSHVVFDWDKNATRAEMAYLFSRADDGKYEPNSDVPMTDIPDINEKTSFAENILALYRRGIATGSDERFTFYPDANVKRCEAATFISRILCYDMRVNLPKG